MGGVRMGWPMLAGEMALSLELRGMRQTHAYNFGRGGMIGLSALRGVMLLEYRRFPGSLLDGPSTDLNPYLYVGSSLQLCLQWASRDSRRWNGEMC